MVDEAGGDASAPACAGHHVEGRFDLDQQRDRCVEKQAQTENRDDARRLVTRSAAFRQLREVLGRGDGARIVVGIGFRRGSLLRVRFGGFVRSIGVIGWRRALGPVEPLRMRGSSPGRLSAGPMREPGCRRGRCIRKRVEGSLDRGLVEGGVRTTRMRTRTGTSGRSCGRREPRRSTGRDGALKALAGVQDEQVAEAC